LLEIFLAWCQEMCSDKNDIVVMWWFRDCEKDGKLGASANQEF
jgi:hypothetical protein